MQFALLLLQLQDTRLGNYSRLYELSLKLCSFALEKEEYDAAEKSLQLIESIKQEASDQHGTPNYEVEYLMLTSRLYLSTGQYEKAELHTSRIRLKDQLENKTLGEQAVSEYCRQLFNVTLKIFESGDNKNALHFAEKAFEYAELIEDHNQKQILLSSILNLLIRIYLEDENFIKAENLQLQLESMQASSPDTYLLRLSLIQRSGGTIEDQKKTILKMLANVSIVDHLDTVVAIISSHAKIDVKGATHCIDYATNACDVQDQATLEQLVTTRIWMCIRKESLPDFSAMKTYFESLKVSFPLKVATKTSSAIITLLWSHASGLKKKENFTEAAEWLELGLHQVFQREPDVEGKLIRNIFKCYLTLEDFDAINRVYHASSIRIRDDPLSIFYLFKASLIRQDQAKCHELLESIQRSSHKDALTVLGFCSLEAAETGENEILSYSLLALLNSIDSLFETDNVHEDVLSLLETFQVTSVLQRSVKTLMVAVSESAQEGERNFLLKTILQILKQTIRIAICFKESKPSQPHFSYSDFEWFASSSYNLGLDCVELEDFNSSQKLSETSLEFIDMIDLKEQKYVTEMKVWRARATLLYFLSTFKLAEYKSYSEIISKILSWKQEIYDIINEQGLPTADDVLWGNIMYAALSFHFEAELLTGNLNAAKDVIEEAEAILQYQCLLDFHMVIGNTAINKDVDGDAKASILLLLHRKHKGSAKELKSRTFAKWVRHLLGNLPETDESTWREVVEDVYTNISDFQTDGYPREELQWLCTAVWNRGVAAMVTNGFQDAEYWCQFSVKLSHFIGEESTKVYQNLYNEMRSDLVSKPTS